MSSATEVPMFSKEMHKLWKWVAFFVLTAIGVSVGVIYYKNSFAIYPIRVSVNQQVGTDVGFFPITSVNGKITIPPVYLAVRDGPGYHQGWITPNDPIAVNGLFRIKRRDLGDRLGIVIVQWPFSWPPGGTNGGILWIEADQLDAVLAQGTIHVPPLKELTRFPLSSLSDEKAGWSRWGPD